MAIEIKQDGRHWLVVVDGESIGVGGFKSKAAAERFIKSAFKSRDDVERFIKSAEEIKKIEWWDDEQDKQMWKILHKAHKAEAKNAGTVSSFTVDPRGWLAVPASFPTQTLAGSGRASIHTPCRRITFGIPVAKPK